MSSLERVYVEQMRHHPYGFALFHPASTSALQPGSVGFFDELGFWHSIAHLEDPLSLKRHGLNSPEEALDRSPAEKIKNWTPRTSTKVTQKLLGFRLGAGALATGLPVDAHMAVEYQTRDNYGAVLISSSPVVREAFYYRSPFKRWVQENASVLLHGHLAEDIKKHGLFVATQTFATKKCAITAWKNPETKATFGFGTDIAGLAELSPEVEWYSGSSESGWNIHQADEPEMKVVFAGGLSFRKVPGIRSHMRESRSPSRSTNDLTQNFAIMLPDEEIVLDCEVWGEIDVDFASEEHEDGDPDSEFANGER